MLPNFRFLIAATLMTAVITFALLSQIAAYLPQANRAKARSALPPAEAYQMPLIVSRAAARRREELHRLTRERAAIDIALATTNEIAEGSGQEIANIIEPEAADPVPSRDVFAEVETLGARGMIGTPVTPVIVATLAGDAEVVAAMPTTLAIAVPVVEQPTETVAVNDPPAARKVMPTDSAPLPADVSVTASIAPAEKVVARKRVATIAKPIAPRNAKASVSAATKQIKIARAAKAKELARKKPRIARQAAPAESPYSFPFSF